MGGVAILYFAVQRRDIAPLWLGLFNAALATHFALPAQALAGHAALAFLALFIHSMYPKDFAAFGARAIAAVALAAGTMSLVAGLLPPPAFTAISFAGSGWLAWI